MSYLSTITKHITTFAECAAIGGLLSLLDSRTNKERLIFSLVSGSVFYYLPVLAKHLTECHEINKKTIENNEEYIENKN
jgi:hypothetical protein